MSLDWGTVTVGRITLRETFTVSETGGATRTLSVEGQESSPDLTRTELVDRHDNLLALEGTVVPVTFTDKPERDGYYTVQSATADLTEWAGDVVKSDWKLSLTKAGAGNETDLQSRLTGAVRRNDFALTGERWHAPSIGHYAYFTGATIPSAMTRTGADGPITVYRNVPAGVSPRWGCNPTDYLRGRVRFLSGSGQELTGTIRRVDPTGWSLTNGLLNIAPAASGTLNVQAYSDGAWHSKVWNVSRNGTDMTGWDSVTLLHNEPEHVVIRLTASLEPGRISLDVALRRGARAAEGHLATGSSSTLAVYLQTGENFTAPASAGYVTATSDDADGNRFVLGSPTAFSTHTGGGISTSATTSLTFFVGTVIAGGSAASGDTATDVTNQYIASLPEAVYPVRR